MRRLWARLKAIDALVVDSLFAVAVLIPTFAGMTAEAPPNNPTPVDALAVGLTLVGVGTIAVRRRHPLGALLVCVVVTAVYSLLDYIENGLAIALLITLYTAATLIPRRQWLVVYGAIAAFLVVIAFVRPDDLTASQLVGNLALFGIAAVFGDSNATRRQATAALEARAEALERNQLFEAERAVGEERLRIARQLHDVVAHALAVIAVQSGVGGHVIDTDPDEAKRVLDNINQASRETLDEMRRMLGVLRGEDGQKVDLAPAPGLADIDQVVRNVRDAGVEVTVERTGDSGTVPAGVALTAFRIVQEALTNVLKHAGPARAEVHIACDPGVVRVEVVDDGRGAAAAKDPSVTHLGLIGMRERVTPYGGELDVGPRAGGGWRVCATLPYERTAL